MSGAPHQATVSPVENQVKLACDIASRCSRKRRSYARRSILKGLCRMPTRCLHFAQVLGPGDSVLVLPDAGQVRVGAGLHAEGGHLRTTRAGVLRRTKAGKLWVQGRQKRCVHNTRTV